MLGLKTSGPSAISKETVTLAHFLDVADAVVKSQDAIKSLDAQAQVRCGPLWRTMPHQLPWYLNCRCF